MKLTPGSRAGRPRRDASEAADRPNAPRAEATPVPTRSAEAESGAIAPRPAKTASQRTKAAAPAAASRPMNYETLERSALLASAARACLAQRPVPLDATTSGLRWVPAKAGRKAPGPGGTGGGGRTATGKDSGGKGKPARRW